MNSICLKTQEAIALSRGLDQESTAHSQTCDRCGKLLQTICLLDETLGNSEYISVSEDFSDHVMNRIMNEPLPRSAISPSWFENIFSFNLSRPFEVSFLCASAGIAVINLFQFILRVLAPVTT